MKSDTQAVVQLATEKLLDMLRSAAEIVRNLSAEIDAPTAYLQMERLQTLLVEALAVPGSAVGAGFAFNPAFIADAGGRVEWFSSTYGTIQPLIIETSPLVSGAVDYTTLDWYANAIGRSATTVHGPYVDYLCNNRYAVSVSQPVGPDHSGGVFVVDILVAEIEHHLLPILAKSEENLLIVNNQGRVLVSTDVEISAGTLVPIGAGAEEDGSAPLFTEQEGWQLPFRVISATP